MTPVDLSTFQRGDYNPGRNILIRSLWFLVNACFLQSPLNPLSRPKVWLLRLFGAKIGRGVYIKPTVNVKFPWLLEIGDFCWIGEGAWMDNLVPIVIGSHVCISQGVYLCTGNHDWSRPDMAYKLAEIRIENGVWIGARALVGPGVVVADHSILTAGSVLTQSTESHGIYVGNPALKVKNRTIRPI